MVRNEMTYAEILMISTPQMYPFAVLVMYHSFVKMPSNAIHLSDDGKWSTVKRPMLRCSIFIPDDVRHFHAEAFRPQPCNMYIL